MTLSHYHVDPVTGFVPPVPLPTRLPDPFASWDALVPDLSALIRSRHLRGVLRGLPVLDVAPLVSEGDRERALLLLTHFANAYVWGGDESDLRLPASVAVPLCTLAREMGRPPIAHYATTTLTNWRLVDNAQPLSVDNANRCKRRGLEAVASSSCPNHPAPVVRF
jgi:indoleamine 2,3-dioxygenase